LYSSPHGGTCPGQLRVHVVSGEVQRRKKTVI